jgi:small-conductance mechanosensitive channel
MKGMRLAGIEIPAPPQVALPILVVGLVVLALLAARAGRALTGRWLKSRPAVATPIACAVVVGGLHWVPDLALPGRLGRWLAGALDIAFVFACALVIARITVAAVTEYAAKHPSMKPAVGVARVSVRLLVGALAVIMALDSVGVPVTPLLTTLGVGSLAVALALQETLANFFAGLYLLADRPVRAGDYIKIDAAAGEGYVESIGWRSARLRTLGNNTIIVPNQKLSQAILTNFHLPAAPVGMTVNITIAHDADAAKVEGILNDELTRTQAELPALIGGKPAARLADLTESGQLWACGIEVAEVQLQAPAGHEVRKRLLDRLHREGIRLGVPARVLREAPQDGEGGQNPTRREPITH